MPDVTTVLEATILVLIVGATVNAVLIFGFDPPPIPNWLRTWFWVSLVLVGCRRFAGLHLDWGTDWVGNAVWANLTLATWLIVVWCWRRGDTPRVPGRGGGP